MSEPKIQVVRSRRGYAGWTLPDGVITRPGHDVIDGWYAVTPNGVAHRCHCWHCAWRLVKSWLHNFRNDAEFWYNDRRDRYGR